jgi:hypothetical protein
VTDENLYQLIVNLETGRKRLSRESLKNLGRAERKDPSKTHRVQGGLERRHIEDCIIRELESRGSGFEACGMKYLVVLGLLVRTLPT